MTTSATPTFGSPLAAYRSDVVAHGREFGKDDGRWIAIAETVQHAATADASRKTALLREAIELTKEVVSDHVLDAFAQREWGTNDRCSCEPIMFVVRTIADAGAVALAAAMLDALLRADTSLNSVQRGRVLAQRARVAYLSGQFDDAHARYAFVETLGQRARSRELKIRAWNGFMALAQMRGNFPEVRSYARRATRLADRAGLTALARTAHYALLVAAASDGRFDEALIEGWKVYQLSIGNPIDEASALQNLGQVLFDSGHFAAAETAFSAVCARALPARILLPALGGLAAASAAAGHEPTMEWAVSEIRSMRSSAAPRYVVTSALLDSARALRIVNRSSEAIDCATESLALARRHGFHEFEIRAEALVEENQSRERAAAPAPLTRRSTSVVREITSLEPPRLPKHVRPTAVVV